MEFRPLTQREEPDFTLKPWVNPLGFAKAGLSAGIDQWNGKPPERQQGASGYALTADFPVANQHR
jgi:hypothetical protein